MSKDNNIKKSMGRPRLDSEAVTVRMVRDLLSTLDDWRRTQDDLPNRPEAIRRLIQKGLEAEGHIMQLRGNHD